MNDKIPRTNRHRGQLLKLRPCHTTRHAGPHRAVRVAIEGRRKAPPEKRVKVVPLAFRTDPQPADRVEIERRIQPAMRKK